jgi:hypothetical protein
MEAYRLIMQEPYFAIQSHIVAHSDRDVFMVYPVLKVWPIFGAPRTLRLCRDDEHLVRLS